MDAAAIAAVPLWGWAVVFVAVIVLGAVIFAAAERANGMTGSED